MVQYTTTILRFEEQGDKTRWTYIEIPEKISNQIKPNHRKSFRVKGKLDNYAIKGVALLPRRGGGFIMAINAEMRKGTGKRQGATLKVQLEEDKRGPTLNKEFLECLADEPRAKTYFNSLAPSHQLYFSKWIDSAKTEQTKTKRLAVAVTALSREMDYGQMIRNQKKERDELMGR